MHIKDYENAKKDLDKAFELNPNDEYLLDSIGEYYLETKNFKKSIEFFTKAIENRYTEYEVYEKRANAYDAVGEHDKAKADRETAINNNKPE